MRSLFLGTNPPPIFLPETHATCQTSSHVTCHVPSLLFPTSLEKSTALISHEEVLSLTEPESMDLYKYHQPPLFSFPLRTPGSCAVSSTMSTPTDWVQFYSGASHLAPPGRATSSSHSPDAAAVGSASSPSSPPAAGSASTHGGGHLTPEGRVAKPIRRRSRASRRTPTTLLNTDTSNFRAMVQQFTGGPSAPFTGGSQHHNGAVQGFGFGQRMNPSSAVTVQPPMYHLQYHHPPPPQQPQYQHQNYMFTLNDGGNTNNNTGLNSGGVVGGGDMFFQRLSSSRAPTMEVSNGYVMDVGSRQAASSSSNENNRSNSYLF